MKRSTDVKSAKQNDQNQKEEYFGIDNTGLVMLFDKYGRNVSFDEDIKEIMKLGGNDGILEKVKSSFERGISLLNKDDINKRIDTFGENKFIVEPMPHCCCFVWEGLEDLMIRILILAAFFQIIVGSIPMIQESQNDWVEGLSIIVAVVIVVSVGSMTNFSKEKKFRELNEQKDQLVKFTVLRDGVPKEIQEEEILVGDIIKVEYGMILPADGLLLEGNEIKVEESSLTGESDLIEKETFEHLKKRIIEEIKLNRGVEPTGKHVVGSPLLFSGTEVTEGSGWYVALRVGASSEKGKIQEQVVNEQNKSKGKKKKGKKDVEVKVNNEIKINNQSADFQVEVKKDESKKKEKGEKKENELVKSEEASEGGDDDEEEEEEEKTPLEEKLDTLTGDIGMFGIISAALTLAALIIRLIVTYFSVTEANLHGTTNQISNWYNSTLLGESPRVRESFTGIKTLIEIIRMIILCIAIIVVAIPEGLPLAVTLSLAFSIGKMMEDNNLVRKMIACETMGGANYICSDKTGTLTKNEMNVETFYDCNDIKKFINITDNKEKRQDAATYFPNQDYFNTFRLSITLNINVEIDDKDEIIRGSKTDFAFIHLLHNLKENINLTKREYISQQDEKKCFPFTSSRKKMSTIISNEKFETKHKIFMKGAPEIVLSSCKYYLDPVTYEQQVITDEKNEQYRHILKEFADSALRTICISYKNLSEIECREWKAKDEKGENLIEKDGFVLIGIFGLKDHLREGVADAVTTCKNAGIKVTGDNIDTANAIARDCNIITPEIENDARINNKTISYTGKNFYELIGGMHCDSCNQDLKFCNCPRSELQADAIRKKKQEINPEWDEEIKLRDERIVNMDQFKKIYEDIRVIARSRPEDKYTLVYGLRKLDHVVAVTGDGTNDAMALSKSDVGFAMGISGTDIAKRASDIIILDDNFASIVQAVKWGRNIYDNIRKFIQFQLTVNVAACILVFICSCIGKETPLSAIQMLWLNLIMDSLGSLALGTEPPNDNLLNRKPYPRNEYIINNLMWKHIFYQAMVKLGLTLFLYLYAHRFIPETNPLNVETNKYLLDCYGVIPGQESLLFQDVNLMTAGPVIFWPSGVEKLADVLPKKCGPYYKYKNLEEAHKYFIGMNGSAHLTVIFNTFVIYTVFNQINARVIDDNYNIFHDLQKNYLFLVVILVEFGLQVIIVSVGGIPFKVAAKGLDGPQWGICFALSFIVFIVSIILKPIPFQKCFEAIYNWYQNMKNENAKEEKTEEEVSKKKDADEGKAKEQGSGNAKLMIEMQIPQKNRAFPGEEIKIAGMNSSLKNPNMHIEGLSSMQNLVSHSGQREQEGKLKSALLNIRGPSSKNLTNGTEQRLSSNKYLPKTY